MYLISWCLWLSLLSWFLLICRTFYIVFFFSDFVFQASILNFFLKIPTHHLAELLNMKCHEKWIRIKLACSVLWSLKYPVSTASSIYSTLYTSQKVFYVLEIIFKIVKENRITSVGFSFLLILFHFLFSITGSPTVHMTEKSLRAKTDDQ